jgi:hypothetical protein
MPATLSRSGYTEFICFGEPDEYPKNTEAVAMELRSRGYDATVPVLNYLIKQEKVSPDRDGGRNYKWYPKDVDLAAQELEERQTYTPSAICNMVLGIDAEQYHRALRDAMDEVREEFGEVLVPANSTPDWFVMHVHPPRMGHDGYVSFSLCDDVRAGLKAQLPVAKGIKPLVTSSKKKGKKPCPPSRKTPCS